MFAVLVWTLRFIFIIYIPYLFIRSYLAERALIGVKTLGYPEETKISNVKTIGIFFLVYIALAIAYYYFMYFFF